MMHRNSVRDSVQSQSTIEFQKSNHFSIESGSISRNEKSDGRHRNKGVFSRMKYACFGQAAKNIYCGVAVTIVLTVVWVATTQCIKYLYHPYLIVPSSNNSKINFYLDRLAFYNAPFFTTWFCSNWTILFFPVYYVGQLASPQSLTASQILNQVQTSFRQYFYTTGQFLWCFAFLGSLWVLSHYMYIISLRALLATDALALFSSTVVFGYFLSWVILHHQFVGLRIVAVILCTTGIALLAYMDGINRSPTLHSVLLAAGAAGGSAIYKVMFQHMFKEASNGHTAVFISLIGILNAICLWPICLVLYFTGTEIIHFDRIPWPTLVAASSLLLASQLLVTFSSSVTYNVFVKLGFMTAVPLSAAIDITMYSTHFYGMKLSGIICIGISSFLVMFPDNWTDYLKLFCQLKPKSSAKSVQRVRSDIDYRTGFISSNLRSPSSGRVR